MSKEDISNEIYEEVNVILEKYDTYDIVPALVLLLAEGLAQIDEKSLVDNTLIFLKSNIEKLRREFYSKDN